MPTIDDKASVVNKEEEQEVFNMFVAGMVNVEVCKATGLTYSQVVAYRIAHEKRCKDEAYTQLKITRNQNAIKMLKASNKKLRRVGQKHIIIHLETELELDYQANYMGACACGCNKDLYKGMSVIMNDSKMIYVDCLEAYLKRNLVVL